MNQELKVKTIGEPSIKGLPETEAKTFYLTLLARVIEQYSKQRAHPKEE